MRNLAFLAPLAAVLAVAGASHAQPSSSAPEVTVSIGGDLIDDVDELGQREVFRQIDQLETTVRRELARSGALQGAQIYLVLTDLKPNRPTFQQAIDRPGLSTFDSISIGGAEIEGEVITADGQRLPVRYSRFSTSIRDVYGYGVWQDADRAFDRLAVNLSQGRLVSR